MENRKVYVIVLGKTEKIQVLGETLNSIQQKSGGSLELIHKSALINIMQMVRMNVRTGELKLSDGSYELVSKRQRRPVFQKFLEMRRQ